MTKTYELHNGHIICTDYDESKKECTLKAVVLDSIIRDLNRYAEKCEKEDEAE